MSELKRCPFCGGEGCIQRHEFVGYTDTFGVVCLDLVVDFINHGKLKRLECIDETMTEREGE